MSIWRVLTSLDGSLRDFLFVQSLAFTKKLLFIEGVLFAAFLESGIKPLNKSNRCLSRWFCSRKIRASLVGMELRLTIT
jgi:hypothetical protein